MAPSSPRLLFPALVLCTLLLILLSSDIARLVQKPGLASPINSNANTNPSARANDVLSGLHSGDAIVKVAVPFGFNASDNEFRFSSYEGDELKKRALTWVQALAGGLDSLGRLNGPRSQVSPWNDYNQLAEKGWTVHDNVPERYILGKPTVDFNGPNGPYAKLKISQSQSFEVTAAQAEDFTNCYREDNVATEAYFSNIYNVPSGAIIAEANFGALYKLIENGFGANHPTLPPLGTRLPDLRRWSDVVWLVWAKQAGVQKASLKYVFRHNIVTAETKGIIDRAAGVATDQLISVWPGIKFLPGEVEFQALLGTAHGKGVAYLIADHRELRLKNIESVNIFTTYGVRASYHLLFTLTN